MDIHYSIVGARPQDVHALASIERAAAQLLRGHAPQRVLDEVTDENTFRHAQAHGRLWVALAGDTPVGFALVEMLAADSPHLEEIDVAPEHGRRGLGTALVRAVCDWASPFYSRLGFHVIPQGDLRPELVAIVRHEAAKGLDPNVRAVMRYRTDAIQTGAATRPRENDGPERS